MVQTTSTEIIRPHGDFAMDAIDLRSDTVSWPTPAMREAMANAAVGDDVYGDDPTVNRLQDEAAALFGKEAALLVASGTQGNLVSIMAHCRRGDEIIVGKQAHIFRSEAGSSAVVAGVQLNTLEVRADGTLDLDEIRAAIRIDDAHQPRTSLIALENTQAIRGGVPLTTEYIAQVADIARENNLKLHIDGARIFNAAAALNIPVKELAAGADSLTFCLSKGLSAPMGSIVVGSKEFIYHAHRARKLLGGGLRQAGIIAAAGLVALRDMPQRLHEDHANARALAQGLANVPYIHVDMDRVHTNFVYFELDEHAPLTPQALRDRLKDDYNILMKPYGGGSLFRAVTHYWITRDHIDQVVAAMHTLLS